MKTLNDIQNVNSNAANVASNNNKINDFGQKIGGARKDLYQAAHEWAAQLADITAEALTKAGGVSKLVRLPNLEKLTEAGAITADQARAALIIWRGIERKPQGSYRADRWAERTRHRLEAAAAVITATEPQGEDVADIIKAARESAEFAVISAAQWPAVAFSFGKYSVIRCRYSNTPKLQIQDARYYRGTASEDPADIARQLREMVSRDEEQAADRRAAGPALGVYMNRAGVYYIAPADRSEIVLQTYEDRAAALKAYREDRAALVARYTALKNFPACRREWNRPRVGEDWRGGENMTPEKYAAVLPFRGVEFGNWVNQTERAALLNSAFDGFHDLAAVLNIAPAAVTLNGSLAFAFASRGHSGAAAHYEPARRVINLTKKSGAGCMAHEWFHAVDNFAAGGGVHNYATERRDHPAAFAILEAIKRTDYYRRSQNLAKFKGDYWTEGRELTARAFEGVCAVMLNAAGICSDFLVNCKSMDEFTAEDVARRSDYYPYPTADEAAALLPLYVAFLREVFGDVLTAPAACYEEAKRAAARAELQRKEAERIAAERAEAERQERERKAAEAREKAAREAEERRQAAAHAVGLLRDVLTARHLNAIATAYDSATAYAVGHLEGEIYTISADIKTADTEGRAYIESRPAACIQYKRVHNAKRIICHRWQVAEIRANKWNARELCETLTESDARDIVRTFADFEKADTWQKAAKLWADTQRLHEAQSRRASETTEKPATADGLTMEKYSEKATVIRGYNADQLAELLAMGGKEWRNLKGGKGVIFSTRRHADELREWMEAQQGEGTTAPAAETTATASAPADNQQGEGTTAPAAETTATASAPADNQQGESVPAATLEPAQDITDTTNEPAAAGLPDWLRVGARVRTRGRFMMSTRSRRPQWVEGEEMEITAISADFVSLKSDTARESVSTATAAADLTPIYSTSEISQPAESEPAAIAASIDTNQDTADTLQEAGEIKPAAVFASTATDKERAAAPEKWMERAPILENITFRIAAPWKTWLCPYFGARDVWAAHCKEVYKDNADKLEEWALTAHLGDTASFDGLTLTVWERDRHSLGGPDGLAPIYDHENAKESNDDWNNGRCVLVPVLVDYEGRRHFVFNFTEKFTERRGGGFYDIELNDSRRNLADYFHQLNENDGKYFAFYCADWGKYMSKHAKKDLFEFLEWIKANGYTFVKDMTDFTVTEDFTDFSGNLNEYAAAFWFRIYNKELAARLIAEFSHIKIYNEDGNITRPATDPAPEPSGDGVGICHSFDTNQDTDTLQEAGEITAPAADPLADIISEARKQESRTMSGLNYGPIRYLRIHVLYADNGKTTAEKMNEYEANLHRVTDPDTYAAYLIAGFDLFVDETQVFCDLRRVFPSLTFQELCKLINDNMGENQQGNGIAAALVPDCVILASADEYTREKFRERHEEFYKLSSYWHGDQVNENRERDLRNRYDLESLALHFLLSHELYYTWAEDRAADCLARVREVYPEATAEQLQEIFEKYRVNVRNLYE